jgi:hypothetical protein
MVNKMDIEIRNGNTINRFKTVGIKELENYIVSMVDVANGNESIKNLIDTKRC